MHESAVFRVLVCNPCSARSLARLIPRNDDDDDDENRSCSGAVRIVNADGEPCAGFVHVETLAVAPCEL